MKKKKKQIIHTDDTSNFFSAWPTNSAVVVVALLFFVCLFFHHLLFFFVCIFEEEKTIICFPLVIVAAAAGCFFILSSRYIPFDLNLYENEILYYNAFYEWWKIIKVFLFVKMPTISFLCHFCAQCVWRSFSVSPRLIRLWYAPFWSARWRCPGRICHTNMQNSSAARLNIHPCACMMFVPSALKKFFFFCFICNESKIC